MGATRKVMKNPFQKSRFYKRNHLKLTRANDLLSLVSGLLLLFFIAGDETYQAKERRFMISEIEMTALVTGLHTGLYKVDQQVLGAMARVPRNDFLDNKYQHYAYKNVALPMSGERHIIPEPFLTAMMVHLMGINKYDKVLEVGFGTGYEAAVLSKLADKVYSIRQENPLKKARSNLIPANMSIYNNIKTKVANGLNGWADAGPFDAILVKQAVLEPPKSLIEQLKPYGRLVVPIENEYGEQRIIVFLKMPDGTIDKRETLYVKMTRLLPGQDI